MSVSPDDYQYNAADPWIAALAIPALFVGLDYRVESANTPAAHLLGAVGDRELTGLALHQLVHKEDAASFFADLVAMQKEDGALQSTQVALSSGENQSRFSVTLLRTADNAVLGFLLQHMREGDTPVPPISHSTLFEADEEDGSLAESEWRWKMAIHSANQAVWDHDFERDRHYVSRTWRALRGLKPLDPIPVTNDDWLRTIHPNDIDHIVEELRKLDAGETDVINYKFRQKHQRGHWVWFYSSGRVVRRTRDGTVARIIGTDTDITEIKQVEMESQRMAKRLEAALEASGMGRWEFDVSGQYAFWDERYLEMAGIEDGNHIRSATDWIETIHPEDRPSMIELSESCLRDERDISCEYRLLRPDGEIRHIRSRGMYVKDDEGGSRYYGVNIDVTQDRERARALEQARARLEYESRHDALTGLANRRFLDAAFSDILASDGAMEKHVAVLHFDIDHFKQINDTLGHDAGDALLKHAASVLTQNLADRALVSRVGGDEFVALVEDAPSRAKLRETAQQIVREMAKPFMYRAQQCNIGTSIGVALSEPGTCPERGLFIEADLALYEAKKAGRGRVRFFDSEMKKNARRRKNSFDALLQGFDKGEITCHYQPQFHAQNLSLIGVEALVRWESANFGLIMPDEFLDTATDMGLMAEFDEIVLKKALNDLQHWDAQGHDVPRISVNVSSHRLNDPALSQRLERLSLPRGRVAFELLESAFLDSRNEVIDANLAMLNQLGLQIEIDDFGSGHASIVSLLQTAPKRLKIDRMLIAPIVESQRQRDLVATIVQIGRMLDVEVIAEGVETPEHVKIMRRLGCAGLQGFGLAHPMPRHELDALLQKLDRNGGCLPDFGFVPRISSRSA